MSKASRHPAGVKTTLCMFLQTPTSASADLAQKRHRVRLERLDPGFGGWVHGGRTKPWRGPTCNLAGQPVRRDWRDWEEPWWVTWLGCLAGAGLLALSLLLL